MRERRFVVSAVPGEGEVEITGVEAHHLLRVVRLKAGDRIVVFDGRGTESEAELTVCGKNSARARVVGRMESRESPLELSLAIAVPKMDSMSRIVQKLTELGASRILPVITERTTVTLPGAARQLARWRRIATEACKQAGRATIPQIEAPRPFSALLKESLPTARFLLTVDGPRLAERKQPASCLAAVGPEGGWSAGETEAALAHGFQPLGLGSRTLRTETAALAAAAILQWMWGDPAPAP